MHQRQMGQSLDNNSEGICRQYQQCCILYRLIKTDGLNLQTLSSKSVCVFVFCSRMKSEKIYMFLIVFDVYLCCFKHTNKYLGVCTYKTE